MGRAFSKHARAQRDMFSPPKDIRSNIIACLDFYVEPHPHMRHTLAFISGMH